MTKTERLSYAAPRTRVQTLFPEYNFAQSSNVGGLHQMDTPAGIYDEDFDTL